jgi:hypothetical protein
MIQRVKINLDVVEAMLYFWQSTNDREKVSELFIFDVTDMPGLKYTYDDEFNSESVRRALSSVTNREIFTSANRKEGRFYNNNLWMMEDLEYTNMMVLPLKKLNLESLVVQLNAYEGSENFTELEVIFSTLHLDEYLIKDNKLIINFFRVKPSDIDETVYIGETEITKFLEEKLKELIVK